MRLFENMRLWFDPVARDGPEAMAVDEWLLETVREPLLRVYRWAGPWVSLGYFGEIGGLADVFPGAGFVRRWTGGGVVDHRRDWTYTLVAPKRERLASERGAESYRRIHALLAEVLVDEGISAHLSAGGGSGAALCFENPVSHDLVGADGFKLAGAGQRRTRSGLLHQGSVADSCRDDSASVQRAREFASRAAEKWDWTDLQPDASAVRQLVKSRYGEDRWTHRRR